MNLFFLRHGKAEPRGSIWASDGKRPLTSEGEKKMYEAVRGLQALELSFDIILSSPFARAWRTAEILAEAYGAKKLVQTNNLLPEAGEIDLIEEVNARFASFERVVLVGHEPFLSTLISILLTGGAGVSIDLKKGALCKLSVEKLVLGKCAVLEWLLTANQMSRLGKGKD
jgi:phosphohistidine phosphatase